MQDNNKISSELGKVLSAALPGNTSGPRTPFAVPAGAVDGAEDSGTSTGGRPALIDAIAQNTAALTQVRGSVQAQLENLAENTRALVENTSKQGVGSKIGGVAGSWASSVLGGGILGPIVSGLVGLFGGGKQEAAAPSATKFTMPPSLRVDAGFQGRNIAPLDYEQNERPRLAAPAAAPQVTVNVSAMDSRSFLDHSGEIANAVRRAMLESSALNDVIGEM